MGSDSRPPSASPVRDTEARIWLARKWAYELSGTAYIPLPQAEIERQLAILVERMYAALDSEPFTPDTATAVGARLVELNCTGATSLWRSIEVLGNGLLADHGPATAEAERLFDRMLGVLGALAAGYAAATRELTFAQQEDVNQALLNAAGDIQRKLIASQAQFDELFMSSASGIAIIDLDGRFIRTNGALGDILGYSPTELTELTVYEVIDPADISSLREGHHQLLDGDRLRLRLRPGMVRRDGEITRLPLTISPLEGSDGRPSHYAVVVEDDSDLDLLARQLSQQILHDLRTKLPNRQYFTTALERWLRQTDPDTGVTLYHLDIDGFSLINGSLGTSAGDDLLQHVAHQLCAVAADEKAMVARVGGDEFAILIQNSSTTPDVMTMVDRVHAALAEPVYIRSHGIAPSVSIGVVHRPPADTASAELVRAADLALRRAKSRGCGQWALFDADQDVRDRERLGLAAGMPGAWENGEIRVTYQPVVRLADRRMAGVEAALSWQHPKLGVINHAECVELAEQTGLIMSLGGWLLRSACEQSLRWWRSGAITPLPVSVALARSQCTDPDLVAKVLRIVRDCELPTGRLRLGLPAGAFGEHREETADNGRLLSRSGISVGLQDFGGTVDDLACLEDFPVSAVRLAPTLVERLAHGPVEESLAARAARNLMETARLAGASVLVSDVRTSGQADWWRQAGCELAGGPLFGAAVAAEDIAPRLGLRRV